MTITAKQSNNSANPAAVIPVFGVVSGESPFLAMAESQLAQYLFGMIGEVVSQRGRIPVPIDGLRSAVESHFAEGMSGGGILMDVNWVKRLTGQRTPDDFALIAWRAYVKSHLANCKRLCLSKAIPLFAYRPSEETAKQVVLDAGGELAQPLHSGASGLGLAWERAELNIERSDFRIAAAYTLLSAARGRKDRLGVTAEQQFEAMVDRLWNERQSALTQLFAVGVLMGESAQETLKQRAKAMYAPGFNVMHLVEVDGVAPGRWYKTDEQKLRDDIAQA